MHKIKEHTHDNIHLAFDTISQPSSQILTAQTFGPGPGKMIVIQVPSKDAENVREDVKVQRKLGLLPD